MKLISNTFKKIISLTKRKLGNKIVLTFRPSKRGSIRNSDLKKKAARTLLQSRQRGKRPSVIELTKTQHHSSPRASERAAVTSMSFGTREELEVIGKSRDSLNDLISNAKGNEVPGLLDESKYDTGDIMDFLKDISASTKEKK